MADSILDRRLVIVTGKGGTGKTTVAATLALAAAAQGRRVALAEMGLDEHLPAIVSRRSGPPVGYEGRELAPRLHVLRIDPYEALAEYLALQIGMRGVVRRVLRNAAFRQLMEASPGWRELITLGKVWHLEQLREGDEERFDLLVVDAPATGHGLTFLDVPRVVGSAVRTGPLRRHAGWVEAMIRDPERTLLLPVSLAEELPARETAELVARLRNDIGVSVDRVVVNAVTPAPFPSDVPDLDARLARLPADSPLPGAPRPAVLAACAAHLRARHALNRRWTVEIARGTGLPIVVLPRRPNGVRGPDDLEALAGPLLAPPDDVAAETAA
ncbi:MAG TPA: ArsA-related P-loop ATPase [Myxococcota bacterium]|nr:ArsA-related P-loop ATPase [Myxococcota bacterium]